MRLYQFSLCTITCLTFVACAGNAVPNASGGASSKAQGPITQIHPSQDASLCLDVAGGANVDGTPVQIARCSGDTAQRWTLGADGTIRVFGSKCLDMTNGNDTPGTNLQIYGCGQNDANQQWLYQNNMLQWAGTNLCISIPQNDANDGVRVLIAQCNSQDAGQIWDSNVSSNGNSTGGTTTGGSTGGSGAPVSASGGSGTTRGSGKYTNLVWADEFNGTALDTTKWNVEVTCSGEGNNEDECYTSSAQNLAFDGQGHLVINVIKEGGLQNGKQYTSGRINSMGKGDFQYGRFEARIQVPSGQGFWPAFWLMPQTSAYGGWPTSGELDIMEILGGNPSQLFGTAHYGVPTPYTQSQGQAGGVNFSQAFHTFAVERDATQVRWYLDDQLFFTLNSTDADFWPAGFTPSDGTPWPFEQNFYIILNLAMGGDFPGAPNPAINNGSMVVDYVHFYN